MIFLGCALMWGDLSSERCEKIDLETRSNFGPLKNRARIPYNRPLGLRHTFRLRLNFSEIDFLHLPDGAGTLLRARDRLFSLSDSPVWRQISGDKSPDNRSS